MISVFMMVIVFFVIALALAILKMPGEAIAMQIAYVLLAILAVIIIIKVIFGIEIIPLSVSF